MLLPPAPRGSIYRKPHAGSGPSTINDLARLGAGIAASRWRACSAPRFLPMFAGGQQRFDGRRRARSDDGTRAWTERQFAGGNSLGETELSVADKSSVVSFPASTTSCLSHNS